MRASKITTVHDMAQSIKHSFRSLALVGGKPGENSSEGSSYSEAASTPTRRKWRTRIPAAIVSGSGGRQGERVAVPHPTQRNASPR